MTLLEDRLTALAAAGTRVITFEAVGLTAEELQPEEVQTVAAGPLAPLLAEAVVDAVDGGGPGWARTALEFADGLAGQHSLLALTSCLDTLLDSSAAARTLGKPLNDALLDGFTATVAESPLLAAARLGGAVRLAASNSVEPYRVWGILGELSGDGPEDFHERLPRILGVALDCWASEEARVTAAVRALLTELSMGEAGEVDALFELGCDRLRSALSCSELAQVSGHMVEARRLFAAVEAAEEARDDAAAYLAVCDAVLGFTAADRDGVVEAADRLQAALDRRAAWLRGAHQPEWLRPRRCAELAWHALVLRLRAAAEHLAEQVWMNAWDALDAVLTAYRAARTVRPLGNGQELAGLASLVEPAVEDAFMRRENFLGALQRAVNPGQLPEHRIFDAATAAAILHRIAAREPQSSSAQPGGDCDDTEPEPDAVSDRLFRIAPTVVQRVGLHRVRTWFAGLGDDALRKVEGIAHDADVARLKASDPVVGLLLTDYLRAFSAHPAFTGDVEKTFPLLVEQTLLFLKSRSDLTRTNLLGPGKKNARPYDYRRKPTRGERAATEHDLQRDFHGWLQAGPLHAVVQVETTDVSLGRADVMVHFGPLRYLTEMKQDAHNNTRAYLEDKYLAQAAEYTNTNAPFGQLLVLDLTPKTGTDGTLRLDEQSWTTTHRPQGAHIERHVLAGIVAGNRVTPSVYST